VLAVVLCALCACGADAGKPREPAKGTRSPKAEQGSCARAARERVRAEGLIEAGRLDRAVRVLHHADHLCPASTSRPLLLEALVDLGRHEEARDVARAVLADARSSPALRAQARAVASAAPPGHENAQAVVDAGFNALARGQRSSAQRHFDRAMVMLERRYGEPVRLEVSNGFGPIGALPWRSNGFLRYRSMRALGPALAMSADGTQLAINDGPQIVVHDRSFNERLRLAGHGAEVTSVAFSRDGRRLLSGSYDRKVRVWDLVTGDTEFEVPVEDPVREVFWLEDEQAIAAAAGGVVSVFAYPGGARISDVSASTETLALVPVDVSRFGIAVFASPEGNLNVKQLPDGETIDAFKRTESIAISKSGEIVAVYRKGSIEIWNMPSRKLRVRFRAPPAFDPDLGIFGERLLIAGRSGQLRLWQLPDGERLPDVTVGDGWIMGLRRDGALAVRDGNTVRYVETRTGRDIDRVDFDGPLQPMAVALQGDGLVATGPDNDSAFTFWRSNGSPLATVGMPHAQTVHTVGIAAERGLMVLGVADKALVIDGKSGRLIALDLPPETQALRLVRGGTELLALGESKLTRWDISGKRVRTLAPVSLEGQVLAVSGDGSAALAKAGPHAFSLWDLRSDRLRARIGGRLRSHPCVSKDGAHVAWIDEDGTFRVWSERNGPARIFSGSRATALALSDDGETLAVGYEGGVRLWSVSAESPQGEPALLSSLSPVALAMADKRVYALATGSDDAVAGWVLDFERKIHAPLESHLDLSPTLAFDGGVLALLSTEQRSVALHDASGRALAVVRVARDARVAYVFARAGWLESFGDTAALAQWARCRIGHQSFAFPLCAERLHERGRLAHLLRGLRGEPPP